MPATRPPPTHLTAEERAELSLDVEAAVGAALGATFDQLERRNACPTCVARSVAFALAHLAAWFTGSVLDGSSQPQATADAFIAFVRGEVEQQLAKRGRSPSGGVH